MSYLQEETVVNSVKCSGSAKPLASDTSYMWQVQWTDNNGKNSSWSEVKKKTLPLFYWLHLTACLFWHWTVVSNRLGWKVDRWKWKSFKKGVLPECCSFQGPRLHFRHWILRAVHQWSACRRCLARCWLDWVQSQMSLQRLRRYLYACGKCYK